MPCHTTRNQVVANMQDRIVKTITLKAPITRVWNAITDSNQFGTWFKVKFSGPFQLGRPLQGKITYPGYEHMEMQLIPRQLNPETYFAFAWCPYSDGEAEGKERETLVEFKLEAVGAATQLIIIESGFLALPDDARREQAYRMNTSGWDIQAVNIAAYVEA